ncbi:hypothetical protein C9374_009764 [Naegleria lovaniensis]|uniref:G domain-containing protein n=1 Tax=Naegleria lovaniensis TaxID=51637 RepID=A0AA88KRF4_NAELO|nr:uncharacterized protein C9374_009764 [Naegleria lovaniensis]KAG2393187.1 hypothetical protein C9374_009764 [Naegleria lovaniensis]
MSDMNSSNSSGSLQGSTGGGVEANSTPTNKSSPTTNNNTTSSSSNMSDKVKVKVVDVIYEVQTRKMFGEFTIPSEGNWRSSNSSPLSKDAIEKKALNDGWKYLTKDWINEGEDSWEYANEWHDDQKHWSHAFGPFDFVRRKKWTKARVKHVEQSEAEKLVKEHGELSSIIEKDETSKIIYQEFNELKQKLEQNCSTVTQQTQKPNILLLGGSGSGKSSLVNAVFGKSLAEIGEGKPITQRYTKYTGEHSPVVIYDSRGIEHGYIQDGFVADTRRFFKKIRQEESLAKHVHVVWYVIDLTQARFQPFEAEFCKEELKGIPIIFVLNKADAVKDNVRDIMIETIANFNLPNCIGIYPTVACCKNFDAKECPSCNSPKIRKRLKAGTCTIMCKECNYTVTLEKTMGIEQLSRSTMTVLPDLVKSVFVNAQQSSTLGKEVAAKNIILEHCKDVSLTKFEKAKSRLVALIAKLVTHYQVDSLHSLIHKKMVSRFEKFYREQGFNKRFGLFMNDFFSSKRETHAEVFLLAAGVEICQVIIKFKQAAIANALKNFETQVSQEIEKEKQAGVMPMQNNVTVVTDPKKTASYASIHDLEEEEEETDLALDKLIANIHFTLDSNIVDLVSDELRKVKSPQRYLELLKFDGNCQFKLPEKKMEVVQEEELHIPLYVYQKAKDDVATSTTETNNSSTTSQQPQPTQPTPSSSSSSTTETPANK